MTQIAITLESGTVWKVRRTAEGDYTARKAETLKISFRHHSFDMLLTLLERSESSMEQGRLVSDG